MKNPAIKYRRTSLTVHELLSKIKKQKLRFFQMEFYDTLKIEYLESLLDGYPLPPLVMNEQLDGSWELCSNDLPVVAITEFANGLLSVNGKTIDELEFVVYFEDAELDIYVLPPSSPQSINDRFLEALIV